MIKYRTSKMGVIVYIINPTITRVFIMFVLDYKLCITNACFEWLVFLVLHLLVINFTPQRSCPISKYIM